MQLFDQYPDSVKVGRALYHFRAPFDTVLFVLDVLRRDDLSADDRTALAVRLLFGWRPWAKAKKHKVLAAFLDLLGGGKKTREQPSMSFKQDAALIRAAFLHQYGIDLDAERGRMSWFRFVDLLGGLTNETAFGKVVELRLREVPAPTKYNSAERQALIQAKARVAIRDEKHGEQQFMAAWSRLADTLIAQAKAGDSHV